MLVQDEGDERSRDMGGRSEETMRIDQFVCLLLISSALSDVVAAGHRWKNVASQ